MSYAELAPPSGLRGAPLAFTAESMVRLRTGADDLAHKARVISFLDQEIGGQGWSCLVYQSFGKGAPCFGQGAPPIHPAQSRTGRDVVVVEVVVVEVELLEVVLPEVVIGEVVREWVFRGPGS